MCGASNLSVDNILERLLALPVSEDGKKLKVTRVGHPARVMNQEDMIEATLEVKASRSDQVGLSLTVMLLLVSPPIITRHILGCFGKGCQE